ncbi:peptidyl-prolyl cis-trans isomerase pin4 [Coniosporium apollinis CBS 100218]|uniref:Peptidyl-prolyl cis-trans isomerase n=1 Tax=Coniosporium apollinis (strain CBS 100218) TaxID=1168221 RepID=R7Z5F9_CONA1|nr:peptidyl-prolyl cis-trans isomerase pin4 [Coniosporium apollinis CBS 100218]EON69343.1 peptidyl-prolyl cis-trans isomerase pin4 [Coniosporium apollinis CBS 100218]
MAPKGKEAAKGGKGKAKDTTGEKSDKPAGKLKPATSINVRHILCEKLSKKEEALTKLKGGAKFDEVAREFSEDKARQGGSLGWKTRGSLLAEFEKVAYDLEPSTTANPKYGEVKTGEGYHIIMVEGRK